MNSPQSNLQATGLSVSNALETITATDVPAALTAAHAELKTTLSDIQTLASTQAVPATGITADRDTVFAAATDATLVVAGLVLGYAKKNRLGDLAAKVALTPTSFARGRFSARVRMMQQAHDAAAGVLASLADYGVTAAMLTDLQTKIDAASAQLSEPRDAIVARKVVTQKLAEAHSQLDSLLREQIDPLMAARRTTDPDGYKLYQAARLVIDRPGTLASSTPPANAPAAPTATSHVTKLAA